MSNDIENSICDMNTVQKDRKTYTKRPENWNTCPTCGKQTRKIYCLAHRYKNKMKPCGFKISDTEVCNVLTSTGQCRKHNFNYRKPCAKENCNNLCRSNQIGCWRHKAQLQKIVLN